MANFVLPLILIILYFEAFTSATMKCYFCPFEPHVLKHLTPNDTLNPRGCYSIPVDGSFHKMGYPQTKTCSWDIVREPFESVFDPSHELGKTVPKEWRLAPPGLVTQLLFRNENNKPNSCELLEILYGFTKFESKVKIIRCYCGTELCNKNWPLCKWVRAADPTWTNPLGCVEGDKFPSDKEPKLYEGFVYKRLDGEPAPEATPVGKRTCDDKMKDVYKGIEELEKLLKDEICMSCSKKFNSTWTQLLTSYLKLK